MEASKHILALPTWGQKCIFSESLPIELANFDLGHPVSDPIIGIAKMCLENGRFFQFSKLCIYFSAAYLQF